MKKRIEKTKENFLSSIKPKKSNLGYWIVGIVVVIVLFYLISGSINISVKDSKTGELRKETLRGALFTGDDDDTGDSGTDNDGSESLKKEEGEECESNSDCEVNLCCDIKSGETKGKCAGGFVGHKIFDNQCDNSREVVNLDALPSTCAKRQCVGCNEDDDCPYDRIIGGAVSLTFCNLQTHTCTGCRDSNDCGPEYPVCYDYWEEGRKDCFLCTAKNSPGCPNGLTCITSGPNEGQCSGCSNDNQCPKGSVCDLNSNKCVQSNSCNKDNDNNDCPTGEICINRREGNVCGKCSGDYDNEYNSLGDCPQDKPECLLTNDGTKCVQCTTGHDCEPKSIFETPPDDDGYNPVCTSDNKCVQCTQPWHCNSNNCDTTIDPATGKPRNKCVD